jgi:hypothetical protein
MAVAAAAENLIALEGKAPVFLDPNMFLNDGRGKAWPAVAGLIF